MLVCSVFTVFIYIADTIIIIIKDFNNNIVLVK